MPNLIKQLKWFLVDQFMFHVGGGGGGGGGPAPVQQTVSNTNIPEYARPYVETMLGQSQALTDINQNPYQTYGGSRIAEFSPLQQQAFANVANQTTAAQLTPATGFATQSGLGSIGTAQQMAGAGERYNQMATNPYAMQQYMNPYVQASLQPQLNLIAQQGGIQSAAQQGAATQAGAFGGSRSALANALTQQNALMAQQAAIGQGYNQAYQQAQQAQQFGANLGLQGLQGALSGYGQAGQAAATLGQLGQTQFGQQQAINQAQQTTGAVQQAQAQQALDQQYQDFLKQKNYPYQQLAFMSDMLRGLPLSQAAQTQYTAPPNAASQLGGLGMSALGIYGMSGGFKQANGGVVKAATGGLMAAKAYKEGGYAGGGQPMAGEDVIRQLTQMLDNPELSPQEVEAIEKKIILYKRMLGNPKAEQIMAPAEGQQMAQRSGIGAIGTGDMVPEDIPAGAGGGIVAFAGGGSSIKKPSDIQSYQDFLRDTLKNQIIAEQEGKVDPFAESKAREAEIQGQLANIRKYSPWEALAMAGLGTMAGTSQHGLTNLGLGGIQGLKSYAESKSEANQLNKLLLQQGVEREKSKYARDTSMRNAMQAELGRMDTKEIGLLNAKNAAGTAAAMREQTEFNRAEYNYKTAVQRRIDSLIRDDKNKAIYDQNPRQIERDAERYVRSITPARTLKMLGIEPLADETPAPGGKNPPPAGSSSTVTPVPVPAPTAGNFQVTAPNGKVYTFPTKEAADKFKAQLPKN